MRSRAVFTALTSLVLAGTVAAEPAPEDRPRGTYIRVAPRPPRAETAAFSRLIFFNPCWGGCTYTPGYENSRTNRSEILGRTANFSQFAYGEPAWNEVMSCLRDMFAPFNVVVTDQDPGANVEHYEQVVAGTSSQAGAGNNVLGFAPFACGVIDNGIGFTFANSHPNDPQMICETAAQEIAHVFGLEHEFLCEDPMTYLFDCGDKSFQDIDAPCGEYSARACDCGGTRQNSVRMLTDIFGPAAPTPPDVEITQPAAGSTVESGFIVRVAAEDDHGIDRVEIAVNGAVVATGNFPPYVFNMPASLSNGVLQVEARAYDSFGSMGSKMVSVTLGAPCGGAADCDGDDTCVDGRCVPGPDAEGGLGADCGSGADCVSGLCPADGDGNQYCTEFCDPAGSGCPDGFGCIEAGNGSAICWPGADDGGGGGGGGCAVGDDGPRPWGLVGLGLLVALCVRVGGRRRRRRA